jgi:hypothetical protein
MISAIFTISLISDVDLPIFFLFREPLAAGLKKSNPGLGSLYAYICNCEQISMAISSTVLISLTPSRKALMISMFWMYEIAFRALQKCFT